MNRFAKDAWREGEEFNGYTSVNSPEWYGLAQVVTRMDTNIAEGEFGDKDYGGIANLNLILAAPDYHAAVEEMLLNEDAGGDGWWSGWNALKAAHQKAKGGTP